MLLQDRRASVTLLAGAAVSIGLAVIPAIVTSTPGSLSLTVGLLGVSITLMIDLIARVERRQDANNRVLSLIDAFDRAPSVAPDIEYVAKKAAQVLKDSSSPLFEEAVIQAFAELRLELDALHRGEYQIREASTAALLARQMDLLRNSLNATSIVVEDERWWHSPGGIAYWDANLRAISRGVRIVRVFMFDEEPSARMLDLMAQQAHGGAQVFKILTQFLPPELRVSIAIYDEKMLYRLEENADGVAVRNTLSVNAVDVRRATRWFDKILQHDVQEVDGN
jgi:hypothetical protein